MAASMLIRLYMEGDGHLNDLGFEYTSDDFGGTVPEVGDLIVSPMVTKGRDRSNPANREVAEVVKRYFPVGQAQTIGRPCVALVISSRIGLPGEADILGA